MYYEFCYKKIDNSITCSCCNDYGKIKKNKVNNIEELINFIKHNCLECCEVIFVDFDSNTIIYILNEISDVIEINYPPVGNEGPYQMFKKQIKVRGK